MTTTCAKTLIVCALQVSHFSSYAFILYLLYMQTVTDLITMASFCLLFAPLPHPH